jgi:hypothetical protein
MRATQLIGCRVYDADGQLLGHVHDLRFEATPPPPDQDTGWTCRLTGLACGRTAIGHRLGYGMGDMTGPWPLRALFTRGYQRRLEIDWTDVTRFQRPRIDVRRRRADYEQARGDRL